VGSLTPLRTYASPERPSSQVLRGARAAAGDAGTQKLERNRPTLDPAVVVFHVRFRAVFFDVSVPEDAMSSR